MGWCHAGSRSDGVALWLSGTSRDIQRLFVTHGLKRPRVQYSATIEDALTAVVDVVDDGAVA